MGVRPMAHTLPPLAQPPPQVGPCPAQFVASSLLAAPSSAACCVVPACEYKRQNEIRLLLCGCQLQLRTLWVCFPAAWTAATILWSQTTPSPALAFPRLSRLSRLPPGVVSDHAPRLPATFGRRIHWLQRWLSISTSRPRNYRHGSPGEARRRSARGVALRDAHDRPLAREGGQGIWLQARGAVWPLGGR